MKDIKILIADDEEPIRSKLAQKLGEEGYICTTAADGEEALSSIHSNEHDIVIMDIRMPGPDGMEVLRKAREVEAETGNNTSFVMITGYGTVETAVQAMKLGASDFILKPIEFESVLRIVERCSGEIRLRRENKFLKAQMKTLQALAGERLSFKGIIGRTPLMLKIYDQIECLVSTDTTAIVYGETGTGKELVARAIHFASHRREGPFIPINCGAIPENLLESELFGHEEGAFTGAIKQKRGKFEQAHRGTLFLDEIGDIPFTVQRKLLRVLEEKAFERVGGEEKITVDVRIVAATNQDLGKLIKSGGFREDLYYRLNVFPIKLPPLRERVDDIPFLADHFIKIFAAKAGKKVHGIEEDSIARMLRYGWPGNVRELENLIERSIIETRGTDIEKLNLKLTLPEYIREGDLRIDTQTSLKELKAMVVEQVEKSYLREILDLTEGNVGKAAKKAGIDNKTLYEKMTKYDFSKEQFKKKGKKK